jgi:hypothetical protein
MLINYLNLLLKSIIGAALLNANWVLWLLIQPIADGHFSVENLLPLFLA